MKTHLTRTLVASLVCVVSTFAAEAETAAKAAYAEIGKEGDEISPGFSHQLVREEVTVAENDTEDAAGSGHGG